MPGKISAKPVPIFIAKPYGEIQLNELYGLMMFLHQCKGKYETNLLSTCIIEATVYIYIYIFEATHKISSYVKKAGYFSANTCDRHM